MSEELGLSLCEAYECEDNDGLIPCSLCCAARCVGNVVPAQQSPTTRVIILDKK